MEVYISTNCLSQRISFEKIIALYIKSGINKIELSSYPDYKRTFKDINRKLKNPNIKYLVHNYFPPPETPFIFNLASLNQEIADKSVQLAKKAIDLCVDLNSPYYSFHGGFLYDPLEKFEKTSKTFKIRNAIVYEKQKALKTFLTNIKILQNYAQRRKVKLLIENNVCPMILKDKLLFVDEKDFLWLFSQKDTSSINILLDTGHLKVSAQTYHFSIKDFLRQFRSRITALHLHDNNGLSDLHQAIKPSFWIEKIIKQLNNSDLILILESRVNSINKIIEQKKYLENL